MRLSVETSNRRPRTIRRLPASGNAALAASALIQAALGIEFLRSGLNKFAHPTFPGNFGNFVRSSPATGPGPQSLCSPTRAESTHLSPSRRFP